jgi:hypothetical protein
MKELENIKRIFWHELGHLCVDIIKVEKIAGLYINNLNISYRNDTGLPFKWTGYVEALPELPYLEIPKEESKFAYSLIGLVSGCVFETIYFHNFLKENNKNFKDCFCMKGDCIGNGDWRFFNEVLTSFRELYPKTRGDKDLFEFLEEKFINIYFNAVEKMKSFFNALKEIVDFQSQIIFDDFQAKGSPESYSFNILDEQLKELIDILRPLVYDYGFVEVLASTTEEIIEKIKPYQDN